MVGVDVMTLVGVVVMGGNVCILVGGDVMTLVGVVVIAATRTA